MKKLYIAPSMEIAAAVANDIICVSVTFGEGTTDTMDADVRNDLSDIELW